jgi:hypothetical protein
MSQRKKGRRTRGNPLGSVDDNDLVSCEDSKEDSNEEVHSRVVEKVNESDTESSDDSSDDDDSKTEILAMKIKLKELKRKRNAKKRRDNEGKESSDKMNTTSNTLVHPINHVSVSTTVGTQSAVSSTTEEVLLVNYVTNCEKRGLMDTESDVSAIVMKVTKRSGWPLFKMLDDEDYSVGSNFAKFIMKKVGRNPATAEAQLWWTSVKQHVSKSMQNSRSVSTQSMKREFLGKINGKAIDDQCCNICPNQMLSSVIFCCA